jgi:AcrR family transcriptional regulator
MSPRISADYRERYLLDRREQILDAAVKVFGHKGFAGANVSDIATAAEIAKGTIYLYFQSKEEIFTTILSERSFIPHLSYLIEAGQPLEVTLQNIAESYFQFMDTNLAIFRLVIADAFHFPEYAHQAYCEIVLKGNQILADFLTEESRAGTIRPLQDPLLTARAFMGMLMTFTLSQEILGGKYITPICREEWMQEMLRVFLRGVKPDSDSLGEE